MYWILGLVFTCVGALFVAGPLGLFTNAGELRWWLRALIATLGTLHTGVGIWILARAPVARLTVDSVDETMRLEQWGITGRKRWEWPIAALAAVQVLEQRDDENGKMFRLLLFF